MRNSKWLPIIIGIILLIAGISWVQTILSIDYTRLRAHESTPKVKQSSMGPERPAELPTSQTASGLPAQPSEQTPAQTSSEQAPAQSMVGPVMEPNMGPHPEPTHDQSASQPESTAQ